MIGVASCPDGPSTDAAPPAARLPFARIIMRRLTTRRLTTYEHRIIRIVGIAAAALLPALVRG
jgi:hypothetical protein